MERHSALAYNYIGTEKRRHRLWLYSNDFNQLRGFLAGKAVEIDNWLSESGIRDWWRDPRVPYGWVFLNKEDAMRVKLIFG